MFYDMKLKENSLLSGPWRAANSQEVNQSENSNISNICENLDYLMTNDGDSPQERLSLRASSVLVDGTVRLFKNEMNRLLQDTFKLSQQVVLNNYQSVWSEDSEDDLDTLDDNEQAETSTELISISTTEHVSSGSASSEDSEDDHDISLDEDKQEETSMEYIRVITNEDSLNSRGPGEEDWDEFERSCLNTQCDIGSSAPGNESQDNGNKMIDTPSLQTSRLVKDMPSTQPRTKRDKATQASGQLYDEESNDELRDPHLDQHLPMALVLMYDDYKSPAPTKILLSSLNPAVKNI